MYQTIPLSKFVNEQSRILREFSDHVNVHFCHNKKCTHHDCFYSCTGECVNTVRFIKNQGSFTSKRTLGRHLQKHHLISKNKQEPDLANVHDNQFPDINNTMLDEDSILENLDTESEVIVRECFLEDSFTLPTVMNQTCRQAYEPIIYDECAMESSSVDNSLEDTSNIETTNILCAIERKDFSSNSMNTFLTVRTTFGFYAAVCRLVCRAAFQSIILHKEDANNNRVPNRFVMLFLNISLLVAANGGHENEILSDILCDLFHIIWSYSSHVPKGELKELLPFLFNIPITPKTFLSKILQPHNSNAFQSIVPIPLVTHNKQTEHAMCSPTEIIPMIMCIPTNHNANEHLHARYQSLISSEGFLEKKGRIPQLYLTNANGNLPLTVLIYIIIWSDGWDPNRSNKGNGYGVWTATGTFIFVEVGTIDNVYHISTELLCAGPGKVSHEEFFQMLRNEKKNSGKIQ